ncbi:MAG: hypothetical protein JSW59_16725 [Phycisphaerales bacterium]|nr:MAG: hypothetical protein JSW59_16725 [Phycisphaerales bacterium]
MKEDNKKTWENITLKSLEARLRSLPEPGIPATLEARLHATIPERPTETIRVHLLRRWIKACALSATAAAVVILAIVLAANHGPPSPSHRSVADLNDGASRHVPADQNTVLIEDTNFVNPTPELQSP